MAMEHLINKVTCGGSLEVMKQIPDNSIDLIVTDPPYGLGYCSNSSIDKKYRANIADTTVWDNFSLSEESIGLREMLRVLKNDAGCYIFMHWRCLFSLPKPKEMLIWDKKDFGMGNLLSWSPSYEVILVYAKGRILLRGGVQETFCHFTKWQTSRLKITFIIK